MGMLQGYILLYLWETKSFFIILISYCRNCLLFKVITINNTGNRKKKKNFDVRKVEYEPVSIVVSEKS